YHAVRLTDKTGYGYNVPVVVPDRVRRVRRYAVRSACRFCGGQNKSRYDVDRVVCRIGQIDNVPERLLFDGNSADDAIIDLLYGYPRNFAGRLKRRAVRNIYGMWC